MKISLKASLLTAATCVLVGFATGEGYQWFNAGRFIESTDNAYVQADSVALRAEISGRILQIDVKENQQVKKGDLLLKIDPSDYQAQVSQAQSQLAVSRAALLDVQAQIELQHRKVDEAKANIEATKAELHHAELELKRAQALANQAYGSRQLLQTSEANAEVAEARLTQAVAVLAAEQEMLNVYQAKRESADAAILAAQAGLDLAHNQLEKTVLLAPSDGVVGNLGARVGGVAQPSATLLYLVPLPQVYVVANFKETQIGHMSIGQPVQLSVDALPEIQFEGVVESLAPATGTEFSLLPQDNATGNFNKIVQRVPVRIRVTGPQQNLALLRPGLSVVSAVDTKQFEQQLSYREPDPAPTGNRNIVER